MNKLFEWNRLRACIAAAYLGTWIVGRDEDNALIFGAVAAALAMYYAINAVREL